MKETKPLAKKIKVSPEEYVYRNLEIMNLTVFPTRVGKTTLKVLEFFIKNGGEVNGDTRSLARKHFKYSMSNLSNHLGDLVKNKCLDHIGGTSYVVSKHIMKMDDERQQYVFSVESE